MTVLGNDSFQRPSQSGWGTADDGQTWSHPVGAATLSIFNSDVGEATGTTDINYMQMGTTTSSDMEGVVHSGFITGNRSGLIARWIAPTTFYYTSFAYTAGNAALTVWKNINGTPSLLSTSSTSFALPTNSFFWVRLQLIGTLIQGRMWASNIPEPSVWHISMTDSSITGSGGFGLFCSLGNASNPQKYNYFSFVDYSVEDTITGVDANSQALSTTPLPNTGTPLDSGVLSPIHLAALPTFVTTVSSRSGHYTTTSRSGFFELAGR